MPTYQYACTACDHRFEAFQSFSESSLTDCPVCAGRLRKLYSGVGIVFKGSGFYRTDSRSGADADVAASAGKDTAKDGAGKDGGKDKAGAPAKESTTASSGGDSGSSSTSSGSSGSTSSGSTSSSSSDSSSGSSSSSAKPAPTASTSVA